MVKNKFTKIIILTIVLILCFSVTAFGESKEVTVYVNNEKIEFDVKPVIENNRIIVPLRGVFQRLDANIDWNKSLLQVAIKDEYNDIIMMLNNNKVIVNGEIKDIDVPVRMVNSRTFAPLRFISETLGHDIKWDGDTYTVYITKNISKPAVRNNLPTIDSKENLIALLEYNSKLFGYIGIRGNTVDDAVKQESVTNDGAGDFHQSPEKDSSDTNNQVEGVQEGDIIKNDGKYIYIRTDKGIKIIDSNPSSPKIVVENINIPENLNVNELFIADKKLVVIGQNNYFYIMDKEALENEKNDNISSPEISIMPPRYYEDRCNVLIYNIENIEKPALEREYLFDGNYSTGRVIDNNLYLITGKYIDMDSISLPSYTDVLENVKTEIGYDKINYFPNYVDSIYMFTIGINLEDKTSKPDVDVYLGSNQSVYVSNDNLYAAVTDYSYDVAAKSREIYNPVYRLSTVIYSFALKEGSIRPVSQGEVPGTIINQFSMDEHNNMLRIATTAGDVWQIGDNESKNNIYILNDKLNIVGKLEGLAPGERIYSTRFMGDKVYMVTFKQVDPLFVIDTANPYEPKVLGFLKIPGYSTYLHPVDENHILGFGYDTKENQWGGTVTAGLKISLFDVSNVNKPKEIKTDVIGKSGTNSELLYNHKALMFSLNKGIMAFPVTRMGENYNTDFIGAYIYNINSNDFSLKTTISHIENIKDNYTYGNEIKRIIYINDYLYTFSDKLMQVHSLENNKMVSELSLK
ncbi:MAG: beta-propeller domain-containing protein [Tissierellia bacterium]|nr:beta-propeller domain-containing protein [Tissierellia bacterium]